MNINSSISIYIPVN